MALRTVDEYVQSLRDSRTVYFRGQRVADVTTHPVIAVAVQHAAIDYRLAEDPQHRALCVVGDGADAYSRYYQVPRSSDDLLQRSALIELATAEGGTLVVLIKEIGTDALAGLLRISSAMDETLGTDYHRRVAAFHEHCRVHDLAVAVAQTDVKGDRSLAPSAQTDPDLYVHIVERRSDGIVVRGAKAHTSVSTNANELIVLPTRALAEADRDYAVSFAIPINTPGLTLLASAFDSAATLGSPVEHPISARHKMMETTTVFDDVFVPWERVFLAGESAFAGPLALAFVEHHRFTAISYKLPLVDALVGAAAMMADVKKNGGRIAVVAGPVVVHTGGVEHFGALIRKGYVDVVLAGNALAVHDIEYALKGTSLGIDLVAGMPVDQGHRNHMAAINTVNRAGGIREAVEQGVLTSGVMYECVTHGVAFVLAGSIRDDGPLPDTIMDLIEAQNRYAEALTNVQMVLMLSSMLHSIGVGNMLPSWVRVVCVDINPAVVTKLSDRGSMQTVGVVTDVGMFLQHLARKLD